MTLADLIRPHIKTLVPYATARDEFQGNARVYLDANENPFDSSFNRYPDPHARELRALIGTQRGVKDSQVLVTNGSDEAIDLVIRAVAGPDDAIAVMPPTYGMYGVVARALGVRVLEAPLRPDFSIFMDGIEQASNMGAKLLCVCSPNNPTGNQFSLDQLSSIAQVFPGLIVIDEAYIDFASGPSALELLEACDRFVVLQTLSKAWGLAGIRVGFAFAAPEFVRALASIKMPYNLNTLSQQVALNALAESEVSRARVSQLVSERERLTCALQDMPAIEQVFSSEANFLLVRCDDSAALFSFLKENGIIVRDRSKEPGCKGCIRITVGTPDQNDEVIECIRRFR
jgi:histidinol-phosphate aminotransferase